MQTILLGISFALLSVIWWPTPYALAADTKVARGAVVAISDSSLSVKVRDQEMKFSVDSQTVVEARGAGTKMRSARENGKAGVPITDVIKVGENVAVTYHDMNGVLHASAVRRMPAGGASGIAEAGPTPITTGTVQSIGANSITVVGTGGGGSVFTQRFVVDEHTKVFAKGAGTAAAANGGRLPFTEIVASGDRVTVSYHKIGGELHAANIRVTMQATH